jgi:hypothetical protein
MPIPFHLGEMSVGEMSVHCTVGEKSVGERSVGDLSPHRIIDIYNSQLLLKLPILDKFRLVTVHSKATQKRLQYKNWFTPVQEKREFL